MKKENLKLVRNWIYRNARPLDLARWQYHFEDGSSDNILTYLAAYQNEDGGFGHALEADCWNPASTPLQTWWAIQHLRELDEIDTHHPLVAGILRYLGSGDSYVNNRWLNTVPSNNDWPGAPWWQYEADSAPNKAYNPTVALAGFAVRFADEESSLYTKSAALVKEAADWIINTTELVEMHELSCFIEMSEDLKACGKSGLIDMPAYDEVLKDHVDRNIEKDSSKWATTYCCKPTHFIKTPDSMFYDAHKALVHEELKQMTEVLETQGIWPVTWQWGAHDKEFAVSSRWWQGYHGVSNCLMMDLFDQ